MRTGALAACGALLFTLPLAARAERVHFVIAPEYTACGLQSSACVGFADTSIGVHYTFLRTPKRTVRLKLSRDYHLFAADEQDGVSTSTLTARVPASDTLYLRLRAFDALGYMRGEIHAKYTYEHPSPEQAGYHSMSVSYKPYFGRPIQRGSDGPARQFDATFKASERFWQSPAACAQWVFSLTGQIDLPLNEPATSRIRAGYTGQQQLAAACRQGADSGRSFAEFDRDFNAWTKGYAGVESSRAATGRSANVVFGIEWTL